MKKISTLVLVMLMLLATSCTWSRAKVNVENFHVKSAGVIEGKTMGDDLERIIGNAPNAIVPMKGNKKIYVYNFGETKTHGLNLILFNFSKSNVRLDAAYFFVNADGIVDKISVSSNSKDVPWEWSPFED